MKNLAWAVALLLAGGCAGGGDGSSSSSSAAGGPTGIGAGAGGGPGSSGGPASSGSTGSTGHSTSTATSTSGATTATTSVGTAGTSSTGGAGFELAVAQASSIATYTYQVGAAQALTATGTLALGSTPQRFRWSPVSNAIGVVDNDGYSGSSTVEVYEANASQVASFAGLDFDWAPTGEQLVLLDPSSGLQVATLSTKSEETFDTGYDFSPEWAPAGANQIAFINQYNDTYGGETGLFVEPLTASSGLTPVATSLSAFQWSPDGSRIAYLGASGYTGYGCDLSVAQIGYDDSITLADLVQSAECGSSFAWSPDSAKLGFGASNLYVVPASGPQVSFASLTGLLATPASVYQLQWTPDGQYIGYLSDAFNDYAYGGAFGFLLEPSAGGAPLPILSGIGGEFDIHR